MLDLKKRYGSIFVICVSDRRIVSWFESSCQHCRKGNTAVLTISTQKMTTPFPSTFALIVLALISTFSSGTYAQQKKRFAEAKYRGFSIPQIDLNDREDLQTVISRDSKIYMGHPSSVLLDDGRTMVMMYLNQHGRGRLMWQRSQDSGRTWSERLPLPEGWDEPVVINAQKQPPFLEIPILYKIDASDGKQRICMYSAGRDDYPARYASSEDGGRTWSKMRTLLFGGKELYRTIVLFSDMIRLKDGRYLATYHHRGTLFTATTRDGISFDDPRVAIRYPNAFPCEGCSIRSPDGSTIALLMRENNRRYNSLISFSEDEGKTWSKPRQMPDSLTGDRHQHTYTPDGRLFISFRDRAVETPSFGDWVGWVGTYEDLKEGREGQYRVRLKDNFKGADCAYPTQHRLPDGTIFAATYGQWQRGKPNYLLGYHFRIEQLDELYERHMSKRE
ncbi:glycoside hydrolase [Acidobacteria bacterium AH-259-G07]|nr:glycoside hydrolase [Acidobacteria bacterium AH-259-G07]